MRGTHDGEFAGVPASGGSIEFAGTDIWRVPKGKIAEGWTLCDTGTLFMQISPLGRVATQFDKEHLERPSTSP